MGAQAALGEGAALRGLPGPAVLLGVRDPAVQLRDPPGRRLPGPPGPGGDGGLRARPGRRRPAVAGLGVDHDTVDPALQPGPRRRRRTSTTPSSSATGAASCSAPPSPPSTPRSSGAAVQVGTVTGSELVGRRYRPLFHYFADTPNAFRGPGRRLRDHRGGHRGRAHGARIRRGRPAGLRGRRHPGGVPGRRPGPLHRRGPRLRGPAGVRGQPAHRPRPARPRASSSAQDSYVHSLPALLADRHPARLQGGELVVRQGDRHQGPPARAQPGDHLGSRPRPRRVVRQMAGKRP